MTPKSPAGPKPPTPRASAPGRPGRGRKRPVVKILNTKPRPATSFSLVWVVALVLLLAGGGYAIRLVNTASDPHYLKARDLVARYETGLPEEQRDYNGTVYKDAIAELDMVNPQSVSAAPAEEMKKDLRSRIAAFGTRVAAKKAAQEQMGEDRAHRLAAVIPVAEQADLVEERRKSAGDETVCVEPDGTLHKEGPGANNPEND